jgi:hypothetical protein
VHAYSFNGFLNNLPWACGDNSDRDLVIGERAHELPGTVPHLVVGATLMAVVDLVLPQGQSPKLGGTGGCFSRGGIAACGRVVRGFRGGRGGIAAGGVTRLLRPRRNCGLRAGWRGAGWMAGGTAGRGVRGGRGGQGCRSRRLWRPRRAGLGRRAGGGSLQ